jgi:sigma-B regulation protein RsbU (phosphoserine phosphatase)
MVLPFLTGLLLGALALWPVVRRIRREADQTERENQKLAQDRQRLLEFMHLMAEALGEGLSRQEL